MSKYTIYLHFLDKEIIDIEAIDYNRDNETFLIIEERNNQIIKRYFHLSNLEQITVVEHS